MQRPAEVKREKKKYTPGRGNVAGEHGQGLARTFPEDWLLENQMEGPKSGARGRLDRKETKNRKIQPWRTGGLRGTRDVGLVPLGNNFPKLGETRGWGWYRSRDGSFAVGPCADTFLEFNSIWIDYQIGWNRENLTVFPGEDGIPAGPLKL